MYSYLQKGTLKIFDSNELVLVFGKKVEAALMTEEAARLAEFVDRFFNVRPAISITADENIVYNNNTDAVESSMVETKEQTALNHPLVLAAKEVLGGEVVKVIPKTD